MIITGVFMKTQNDAVSFDLEDDAVPDIDDSGFPFPAALDYARQTFLGMAAVCRAAQALADKADHDDLFRVLGEVIRTADSHAETIERTLKLNP
jgi:hypothetical protein